MVDVSKQFDATVKSCTISYPVEYAAIVHNGATLINGTVLPARAWTQTGMAAFDFEGTFAKLFGQYGDFDRAFKETCLLLSRKFTEEISSPKWQWNDDSELRDIIDTGLLRASQTVKFQ